MTALRARLVAMMVLLVLASASAGGWADSPWRAAGFLISPTPGQTGSTRTGSITLAGATPRPLPVTVARDARTLAVRAASIDAPLTWQAPSGFTVIMPSVRYDSTADVFHGGAVLTGGGLPVRMRVAMLAFNADGIVSMRDIGPEHAWTIAGTPFTPREGRYERGLLVFRGPLALLFEPEVEVTVRRSSLTLRGPLAPYTRLTPGGRLAVTRLELLGGHLVASGTSLLADGRLFRFTRCGMLPNGEIDVRLPKAAPRRAPVMPGGPPPSRPKPVPPPKGKADSGAMQPALHLPIGEVIEGRRGGACGPPSAVASRRWGGVTGQRLVWAVSPLLRIAVSPGVLFAHAGVASARVVMGAVPLVAAFAPGEIAQSDPLQQVPAVFSYPGSTLLEALNQITPMQMRMTSPSVWAGYVPTGYVTLGEPAFRVYARRAPVDTSGRVDIGRGHLSWQSRHANVKSYFTNEITPLELIEAPKLEQQKGFWGKRAVEAENGQGQEEPAFWFFTTRTKGSVKPFRIFGQEAVGQRVQANETEFGQVLQVALPRLNLFSIGSVGFYINFGGNTVTLYHALVGTQKPEPDRYSGVLFEASTQVPGLEIQFGDGFTFKFTDWMTVGSEAVQVLMRYTSTGYFRFRFHSDVSPKSFRVPIAPPLLYLTPKSIDLERFPGASGRSMILNGTCAFVLEIAKIFYADCQTKWYYEGVGSWGLNGTAGLGLELWLLNVKVADALADLNFGKQRFQFEARSGIANYLPLAVKSFGVGMQIGSHVFTSWKNNTWDNWLLKLSLKVKFLWAFEVPVSVWFWANGEISVKFSGADPVVVDPNSKDFKGDLWLYGVKTRATYALKRSEDGTSTEMFVSTEAAPPFGGTEPAGGTAKVSGLRVLPVPDGGEGNVNPGASGNVLLPGARVEAGFDLEAVSSAYDGKKMKIHIAPTELRVDGTGSAGKQSVPVSVRLDGGGEAAALAHLEMAPTAEGGSLTVRLTYTDEAARGKVDLYTFTWAGKR